MRRGGVKQCVHNNHLRSLLPYAVLGSTAQLRQHGKMAVLNDPALVESVRLSGPTIGEVVAVGNHSIIPHAISEPAPPSL